TKSSLEDKLLRRLPLRQTEELSHLLATHLLMDIQKRSGKNRAVDKNLDPAELLHDEEAAAAVTCVRNRDRRCKAGSNRLDLNRWERAVLMIPRVVESSNRWII